MSILYCLCCRIKSVGSVSQEVISSIYAVNCYRFRNYLFDKFSCQTFNSFRTFHFIHHHKMSNRGISCAFDLENYSRTKQVLWPRFLKFQVFMLCASLFKETPTLFFASKLQPCSSGLQYVHCAGIP